MRELVFEILLRLSKALAAAVLGAHRLGGGRRHPRRGAVGDPRPALLAERRRRSSCSSRRAPSEVSADAGHDPVRAAGRPPRIAGGRLRRWPFDSARRTRPTIRPRASRTRGDAVTRHGGDHPNPV